MWRGECSEHQRLSGRRSFWNLLRDFNERGPYDAGERCSQYVAGRHGQSRAGVSHTARRALAVLWPCDELTRAEGRLVFYCFSFPVCVSPIIHGQFTASARSGLGASPSALCGRVLELSIARAAAPTGEYPSTASRGTSLHARLIGSRYAVCNGLAAESACNTSSLKSSPRVPVLAPQHAHTPGINCISSSHRLLTRSVPLP